MVVAAMLLLTVLMFSCRKDEEPEAEEPLSQISAVTGNIQASNISADIQWLQNMTSRFALCDNRKTIASGIRDKLQGYGYTDARLDSFYISGNFNGTPYSTWQYNVIATLTGSGAADSLCVAGAHYDCINDEGDPWTQAPGADDNASGVAAMLEMARVIKQSGFTPRTTLVFAAFAAEELDLFGSADLAQKYIAQGMKVRMMLNLDMIGYEPDANTADWEVNIMNYDNSENLRTQAESLTRSYTLLSPVNDNQYNEEGDSYSFYQKGFPALFFISYDEDPAYHTSGDVSSQCNSEYCSQVAKLSCSMLLYNNR